MYDLRNKGRPHIDKFALADHIMNDRWGDAQLLFDGSYNCTAAGNAGAAIVNEKPNGGGIDFSCVGQLPMVSRLFEIPAFGEVILTSLLQYLPRNTPCPPSTPVGGICPFGYLH